MLEEGTVAHAYEPTTESNVTLANKISATQDIISDVWNKTKTYADGDYSIYNNILWKCLVQHSGQVPSEGTYWTKVSVASEIGELNRNLAQ